MVNQKNEESEKKCRRQLMIQQATRGATVRTPRVYTTHNNMVEMLPLNARCRHSTATPRRPRTLHTIKSTFRHVITLLCHRLSSLQQSPDKSARKKSVNKYCISARRAQYATATPFASQRAGNSFLQRKCSATRLSSTCRYCCGA